MYVARRYSLALYSSHAPAARRSRPRRPAVNLHRVSISAERQLEESDETAAAGDHGEADVDVPTAPPLAIPRLQNGQQRPRNGGAHTGYAAAPLAKAAKLPWDSLVKISQPKPSALGSNGDHALPSAVTSNGEATELPYDDNRSKKESPLDRTLSFVPPVKACVTPLSVGSNARGQLKKSGWRGAFADGDDDPIESIGSESEDEGFDSFGRLVGARRQPAKRPQQVNGHTATFSQPTHSQWAPPLPSHLDTNNHPNTIPDAPAKDRPQQRPTTPLGVTLTEKRPLPEKASRASLAGFEVEVPRPRNQQAGASGSNPAQAVEQMPLPPPPPEWNRMQRNRPGSSLLQSMKGKLERGRRSGRVDNASMDVRRRAEAKTQPREQTALPWSVLNKVQLRRGDAGTGSSYAARLDRPERYGESSRGRPPPRPSGPAINQKAKENKVQTPPVPVTVKELGLVLAKKSYHVMRAMRKLGEWNARTTSLVDPDTAELVAMELGLKPERAQPREWDVKRTVVTEEMTENMAARPPVVSVMGHVDHGKTTLLDALRTSKVAGTEAAGITQKIGAFSVNVKESAVTFFDTPGHAAFKSMRHSTSRLTDIVVVVIAGDDGVKAQTLEVLGLLKEFPNLAPVVAVTKIDRPGVDADEATDRISRELLQHDVITEAYGGQVPIVPVSAVTREGFDDLLETLLLQAEIMELKADEQAPGEGVVVESSLVKGRGLVTDVLVSWGKLKVGDIVLSGTEFGKVKSMTASDGKTMKEAVTAQPVRVIGFKGLPKMGDDLVVVESEEQARTIIGERERERQRAQIEDQGEFLAAKRAKEEAAQAIKMEAKQAVRRREKAIYDARIALGLSKEKADDEKAKRAAEAAKLHAEECIRQAAEAEARAKTPYEEVDAGGPTPCHAVFKAEGFGMLEAMTQVLDGVAQDEVKLNVIRQAVGPVTQSDVDAAITAGAPIFAFNVGVERPDVKALAKKNGVQIFTHKVIYRFLDDVKMVMSDLLPPDVKETVLGEGDILEVFDTKGKQGESVWIAGTNVRSGKLTRSHLFRVLRNGEVVKEGLTASSMRRFKDRVNEVSKGKECGVALDSFDDLQQGDTIQCYSVDEVKRSL